MVTTPEKNLAMEEALHAAFAKMNSGAPALHAPSAPAMPTADAMPLLMSFLPLLPKLLERSSEDNEASSGWQKEELQSLREQMAKQQQLIERVFNAQKAVMRKLSALETVQSAIGGALTSLTEQMARVELVDDEFVEPSEPFRRNGHSHPQADFVPAGMGYPLARDDPRRRARRG